MYDSAVAGGRDVELGRSEGGGRGMGEVGGGGVGGGRGDGGGKERGRGGERRNVFAQFAHGHFFAHFSAHFFSYVIANLAAICVNKKNKKVFAPLIYPPPVP